MNQVATLVFSQSVIRVTRVIAQLYPRCLLFLYLGDMALGSGSSH